MINKLINRASNGAIQKRAREDSYQQKLELSLLILNRWERTIEVIEALQLRQFAHPSENEIYRYAASANEWIIDFRNFIDSTTVVKELDTGNWYLLRHSTLGTIEKRYGNAEVQKFIFANLGKF